MADDLRIPPAVSLNFERAATEVCNRAKLDYDDWNLRSHELVTHLQERWKDGIEKGLSTDAAAERALALFGDLSLVAKSLRKPWHERILLFKRFRQERFFLFLAAYVFYSWLAVLDVHFRAYLNNEKPDLYRIMLPFSWDFFRDGLGTFFVGLAAVGCVVVVRWQALFRTTWLNQLLKLRHVLALISLFALFELVVRPVHLCYVTICKYEADLFYQGYCGLHLAAIFLGWFGAACLVSELLDLPSRVRRRQTQARPFGVPS